MINTKHLINSLKTSVGDNLVGLVSTNDGLQYIPECYSVVRKDFPTLVRNGKVLLISGGKQQFLKIFNDFLTSYNEVVPDTSLCLLGLLAQVY